MLEPSKVQKDRKDRVGNRLSIQSMNDGYLRATLGQGQTARKSWQSLKEEALGILPISSSTPASELCCCGFPQTVIGGDRAWHC